MNKQAKLDGLPNRGKIVVSFNAADLDDSLVSWAAESQMDKMMLWYVTEEGESEECFLTANSQR
jgi:hypothetical protein